mmetsp:Transcript_58717/g.94870  ORF Transcript_58717/g.94870 Transcript_58717/m.94870 type:complete len:221 (-) Transcript_58717:132-794(-)
MCVAVCLAVCVIECDSEVEGALRATDTTVSDGATMCAALCAAACVAVCVSDVATTCPSETRLPTSDSRCLESLSAAIACPRSNAQSWLDSQCPFLLPAATSIGDCGAETGAVRAAQGISLSRCLEALSRAMACPRSHRESWLASSSCTRAIDTFTLASPEIDSATDPCFSSGFCEFAELCRSEVATTGAIGMSSTMLLLSTSSVSATLYLMPNLSKATFK